MSYESLTPQKEVTPIEKEGLAVRKQRAEALCQQGDYATIIAQFSHPENQGLFAEQQKRLQEEGARGLLKDAMDKLQPHDWEMLTLLELFDRATYEHCVRTYALASEKIESSGPVGAYLRERITAEGLSPWDIELACLLHDVGKITLSPKELLLNNTLSGSEWQELFTRFCHDSCPNEEEAAEKIAAYTTTLRDNPRIRGKDITPLRLALTEEEAARVVARGFDISHSLGAIIDSHQDASVAIAGRYYTEAPLLALIGNHHEQPLAHDDPLRTSQSTVRLSTLIDTLRLADEFDAYHSERPYKVAHSRLASLAFLTEEAERGFVDTTLTKLWIADDMKNSPVKAYLAELADVPLREEETRAYQKIQAFLETEE